MANVINEDVKSKQRTGSAELSRRKSDVQQSENRLEPLSPAERRQILVGFNDTALAYPREACLHALFEAQATRTPAAIALRHNARTLSYAELNQQANRLAHHLRKQGVGPDARVAICMARGPEMVVGLLAILKAGGAYVPLDPAYPADRLSHMLHDSAPAVVLRDALGAVLDTGTIPVVEFVATVAADVQSWAAEADTNPQVDGLTSRHLAYVIYTSGSTGVPKGVAIEHRNAVNFVCWARQAFSPEALSETLLATSINFDLAVYECFVPLACGATVTIVANALALIDQRSDVSLINTVPSAMAALVHAGAVPPATRVINLAGEALKRGLVERIFASTQVQRVCNLYGPTETTTYSTWIPMSREQGFVAHIGRPIANTQVYILDAHNEPVPIGVVGEIHIAGDGVARGYLNRPELTAERFIADPFSDEPDARMYKTGDLGRWLSDGTIEYLGRNDFQVKIRGFRIELGEIESRLLAHASVRDAVVLAREDHPGDTRLVAYVTARLGAEAANAALDTEALRQYLIATLPDYMVPAAYVVLEALPLTLNGKLDRRALPAPAESAYQTRAYEAPIGEIEEQLAAAWCEVLNVRRVGRHDNFFELGGHSLLAVGLMARLRRTGMAVDGRAIFATPTLAGQARLLAEAQAVVQIPQNRIPDASSIITPDMLTLVTLTEAQIAAIVTAVPGGAANIQDIYPLAPMQDGMLFHHLMQTDGDVYLLVDVLGFASRPHLDRYIAAAQCVVMRHDALRTAFCWEGLDEPVQVVLRHAPLVVEEVLLDPKAGDALTQLRERFNPRRSRLDLRQPPLWRLFVAHDAANDRWLALSWIHHLVVDQTTLMLMHRELTECLLDQAERLPAPVPFRNFIAQTRLGGGAARDEAYFRQRLADIDEATLPYQLGNAHGDGTRIVEHHRKLDAALCARLRASARVAGVSAASLFHLAWAMVVAKTAGRADVVFGTTLFGRLQGGDDADRAVGLFLNLLPVRLHIGDSAARVALRQTYEQLTELLRHEHAPLSLAQRCSGVLAPQPLFTAAINYRYSDSSKGDASEAQRAWSGIEKLFYEERTNFPFCLSVNDHGQDADHGQDFSLDIQVDQSLDPVQIADLVQTALESLVSALEDSSATPVSRLAVLPEDHRQQVLHAWNQTQANYPDRFGIHEVFEAQVRYAPDAIAVVDGERSLSYRELNRRANRLAAALRSLGVGPDRRVAICVERSLELVVGLVGILKSGGAYVPLDPAYPAERLNYMITDSQPRALVVHGELPERLRGLAAVEALPIVELGDLLREVQDPPADGSADEDDRDIPTARIGRRSHHLAYLIYTSGSTGLPKGVMIEHRNVLRLAINSGYAPLGPDDCVAHCASPSFDASTWEIWAALLNGGRVLTVPQAVLLNPLRLNKHLIKHHVTAMWLTAGLYNEYVDVLETAFAQLRYLLVGGDVLDPATVRRTLAKSHPPQHLINGYGPTESTTFATTFEITHCDATQARIPLGRPIGNTRIYVLDAHGEPVPQGVVGELYIAGDGVARGYLNQADLTAERFMFDPFYTDPFLDDPIAAELFAGAPKPRMYKTGDRGRHLPDGTLEFWGRNDHQVKVRGYRIEPGEIEARLTEHGEVHEAVVLAREDRPGDQRLVAYVTAHDRAAPPEIESLRQHLTGVLPDYMVPSAYVLLDLLPLTPNGKIDRQRLPAPDDDAYLVRAYEAPLGPIEAAVAAIWAQVLKVERVGRHDNFFELGGHSLLAVGLMSRLRQQLQAEVSIKDLFVQPVLQAFAQIVAKAAVRAAADSDDKAGSRIPVVARNGHQAPSEVLSFAQQRLWFLAQMQGGSEAYHIPMGLRLCGTLNVAALRTALDRLVRRHEALRTCIVTVDGVAVQRINTTDSEFALTVCDLRAERDVEAAFLSLRQAEAAAPFDLSQGPLVRGQLLRLGEAEYVLLITLHHLIADGWSLDVLRAELGALYRAGLEGHSDPLPPLPIQYADYAAWQRQWLSGAELQRQADYWRQTLAGAPTMLSLPLDHPRPPQQRYAGAAIDVTLDADLTRDLKALARRHGMTLYMVVLAAWAMVLARLSGQDEVVIGTPVANRRRTEFEGLIGLFVNTLVLRLGVGHTVEATLQAVKARTLDAQEHQDLPFEQLVELLKPPRSLAHTPIFQVMFSWQNFAQAAIDLPGLQVSAAQAPYTVAKFDLELNLGEADDCIVGQLLYAAALFDRATMVRHVGYLRRTLVALVADAHAPVDRLALLDGAEREQLLHGWNQTARPLPGDVCVPALFEAQVLRTPDAPALLVGDTALSYAALNARANALAHHLIALGVRPDARVAIALERGSEMLVAMLAVLKAGGAYVPLDPAYPAERLHHVLADSAPAVVLTQQHLLEGLRALLKSACPTAPPALLALDGEHPAWARSAQDNPPPASQGQHAHDLAYLIYTSGSTGLPKGVMVEHRAIINFLASMAEAPGIHAGDRVLALTTLSFDIAALELLLPLLHGACTVIAPRAAVANPQALQTLIADAGITVMQATPTTWRMLLADGWAGSPALTALCGGEPLPTELARRLRPQVRALWNLYGPTETTVWSSRYCIEIQPTPDDGGAVATNEPIGRPIANTQIYILDAALQPVPIGVVGEIYIGGAGVARGYLNRPELTAERFIADPFSDQPDARMYKTGDTGRYRADGCIECLGRNDFQVKVRGHRIELGEIEARLSTHAQVRAAVVLAREDQPGDQRLVAYVTAQHGVTGQPGGVIDIDALRQHLAAGLPDYMVPVAYVVLDALPLTLNGKLDRKALPAPDAGAYTTRAYEPPVGDVECTVARIWAEVLKVDRVGRHDHFFELGGHSLLAVTMIDRLRRAGVTVDVRALFAAPTLAALATAAGGESAQVSVPPNLIPSGCTQLTPAMLPLMALTENELARVVAQCEGGATNVQDIYPLAPMQLRMLFQHQIQRQGDVCLLLTALTFDKRGRLDQYAQALQATIERHDILRTAFIWDGVPEPVQVVLRQVPTAIEDVQIDPAAGDALAQLQRRFDPLHYRLDVRCAPLLKLIVAEDVPNQRWVAVQLVHHLLIDQTTLGLLQNEVQAHLAGHAATLPPPFPYRNFVAQARLGVSAAAHQAFFRSMLADVDTLTAPFGLSEVQGDGSHNRELRQDLEPALGQRLRACARAAGVSAATLIHVAWALVLARVSGREDVVFGTLLFGRLNASLGADQALGMFINLLPLRVQVGDEPVASGVRKTHEWLMQLMQHEHAPLALAQGCSGIRVPSPLFAATLNYRHVAPAASNLPASWAGIDISHGPEHTSYPFAMSVDDYADRFEMIAVADAAIDPQRVCGLMHAALDALATALERAPTMPLRRLDILPTAERSRVLLAFNDTAASYPRNTCVHELFEAQAARTPDAVAAVHEGQTLSYAELNRQANRLAHHLRTLGVGPDAYVAICVPRGLQMVIGLLAILKAGGAYVPLDPTYPPERLHYMLADSAPAVLLMAADSDGTAAPIDRGAQRMPVLDLVVDAALWANAATTNPERSSVGLSTRHLAYLIYTSGSTGVPKGVMVEHANVVNLIHAHVQNCTLTAADAVLQFASFSFDASVEEIFPPLCVGARIVLRPQWLVAPDAEFLQLLRAQRITVAELPTAFWHQWAQSESAAMVSDQHALRLVVVGGEKVERHHFDAWRAGPWGRRSQWLNTYGPTEGTVYASALKVAGDSVLPAGEIAIGAPIANVKIYLLDQAGLPVPIGAVGEIYIAGDGVARGYLNRPDLTAERFVPDPFSSDPAARMYRSGDEGRYRPDGQIEYLGRSDQQVKIRGYRIELGEIEARLLEHPGVSHAVVLAREDQPGDKRLVAYVTRGSAAPEIDAETLRSHLVAGLPEHMVPAAYVLLDQLPLTPSGKIDRKALPAPDADAFASRAYEAPLAGVETLLAQIWADLLKLPRVGRHDNFFALGGHSLLAITLIEQMRRADLHTEVRNIFTAPTLAALASQTEELLEILL